MRRTIAESPVGAALLAVALGACSSGEDRRDASPDADLDADADADLDTDEAADADADTDADAEVDDADLPDSDYEPLSGPGPLTFISDEAGLVKDRLCDLDGDGDMDNTFADLGTPASDLVIMTLNAAMARGFHGSAVRLLHIPWVEDRAGPNDDDFVIIFTGGVDTDDPPDPSDDRDGHEPFWGNAGSLDACGEPAQYLTGLRLVAGSIDDSAAEGVVPVFEDVVVTGARVFGSFARGGTHGELLLCAYAAIHDLGGAGGLVESDDLTTLEVLLAGGAAFGLVGLPGVSPDVDVDHDGLERFELDDANHIVRCIDGDLSVTTGRDCWQGEGMADGFSLNLRFAGVPAEFLGREPGWQTMVDGTCEDPPATSLFDPR